MELEQSGLVEGCFKEFPLFILRGNTFFILSVGVSGSEMIDHHLILDLNDRLRFRGISTFLAYLMPKPSL